MVQIGIGAGFASVFGTPLAGAVFALEVIIVGRMRYDAILPIFLASFFANYACHAWGYQTHSVQYNPGSWTLCGCAVVGVAGQCIFRTYRKAVLPFH